MVQRHKQSAGACGLWADFDRLLVILDGDEFIHTADVDGFEIELDTNGTYYISGKELIHCQLGQKFTLIVAPKALIGPCPARSAGPGRRY